MAMQQQGTRAFVKNEKWIRLAICIKLHVKKALVGILHNTIKHQDIKGLPSDPTDLFNFMVNNKNKLNNLRQDQLSLLMPKNKEVISDKLDITMLRFLIQTFSGIRNEDKNWKEPRDEDISIAAAVYRAAKIRNEIVHHGDPEAIDDDEFEAKWCKIKIILADLQYKEDISGIKNGAFDPSIVENFHSNMAQDFEKILIAYKEKCKNEKKDDLKTFIERKYKDESSNDVITKIDLLLDNYDSVMVSGEAGLGKTFSAKNLKYLWTSDDILTTKKILYIDSKRVNKKMYKPSNAAPICVSELGGMLRNKTDEYLKSFGCVTKPFKDLIVIIDGVDELQIEEDKLDQDFLMELQEKIDKNDDISAMETIMGIYFGMFFPESKIIVFGRKSEIDRLKGVKDRLQLSTLFNEQKRVVLKLQHFDEEDVKSLIYRATCNKTNCYCDKCTHTYSLIKDFELRTVPSHLMALIRLFECLPDPNFGRITKTKIFIITIFNLFKNHSAIGNLRDFQTFKKLVSSNHTHKLLECIQNIAKMSFFSLIDEEVTIKVEGYNKNDVDYFKYKQMTEKGSEFTLIERDTLEQLDFFYARDYEYYVILEPHNLTNMEFLSSCYFYSHPNEWDYILELDKNRQLLIISYIAGLYSKDISHKILLKTS